MRVPNQEALADATLQEAKEAVADALVGLACDRVTGSGPEGSEVVGRSPRSAFVSGLLLPRFDEGGQDETSDIHVSILGIDAEVLAGSTGVLRVSPTFSMYVRVLPSWEDIGPRRDEIAKSFNLSRDFAKRLSSRANEIATQLRLQRALGELPRTAGWQQRKEYWAGVNAVRQEAYRQAREQVGLPATSLDPGSASLLYDSSAGSPTAGEQTGEVPLSAVAGDSLAALIASPAGSIDPLEPLMKWRRLVPNLPTLELDIGSSSFATALVAFNGALALAMRTRYESWLAEGGAMWLWRDVRMLPSDLVSRESWEAFLGRARQPQADSAVAAPPLDGVRVDVSVKTDFVDAGRRALRVSIENANQAATRSEYRRRELAIFQVGLRVELPRPALAPLRLDRIDPSYRFRNHLSYPAMGLNCGVEHTERADVADLRTTWAPRWVQPRLVPSRIAVECRFSALSNPSFRPEALLSLPQEYRTWIEETSEPIREELERVTGRDGARERQAFAKAQDAQRQEAGRIEAGVRLLIDSAAAHSRNSTDRASIPWRAWSLMNAAFLRRDGGVEDKGWRLFQLAFVLAHLPTLVSREEEWSHLHDPVFDEDSASLLYFPTGGGKSEAFYGVLVFAMFFDRLRGKDRGVTGLVRYPLRLLTLQQAQRLLRLLVHAELLRAEAGLGTWPFEIGFWVGQGNTPNRARAFTRDIPTWGDTRHPNDLALLAAAEAGDTSAKAYVEDLEAYNKVPKCPSCSSETGLRRFEGLTRKKDDGQVRIVCFGAREQCAWKRAAPPNAPRPLPFLLSDDTIYQRAPAVIVGTVDKLAMLGQNLGTIGAVLGMFGLARWILPNGHLMVPRSPERLQDCSDVSGATTVFPAYQGGTRVFHDPFPAVVVQDEGHLLEASLGTFSGLFETLLESIFRHIATSHHAELRVATWLRNGKRECRAPRVIMATATVSRPEAQLLSLYQRTPILFPSPGHDIWRSFFAEPAPPPATNPSRASLSRTLPPHLAPEAAAPWMRLFVSLMTNGGNHTVTTASIVSAFHVEITRAWRQLLDPAQRASVIARFRDAVRGPGAEWRRRALDLLASTSRYDVLLSLIDLHRVSLTYVTNKKGGDQVIDALDGVTRNEHARAGVPIEGIRTELISGGVDMRDIQEVMKLAERAPQAGEDWPDPDASGLLRNVVATSAISHGVDVDRFNAMFFAGLPADIAEYIQASSRVGRQHVGFVLLVPSPHSRRDRYVVETHDVFHRFLERMIQAPASERWAENALRRVAASYIQAWLALREYQEFAESADNNKTLPQLDLVPELDRRARRDRVGLGTEIALFSITASGLPGRGPLSLGQPADPEHYRGLQFADAHQFISDVLQASTTAGLADFWKARSSRLPAPMTSLRDVDEAGLIKGTTWSQATGSRVEPEALYYAMKVVRGQRYARSEAEPDSPDLEGGSQDS